MIHIPKTGGTWCRVVVRDIIKLRYFESNPAGLAGHHNHGGLYQAYESVMLDDWRLKHPKPKKRFIFSFVRHPVDWLASQWAFVRRKCGNERTKTGFWALRCNSETFEEFVRRLLDIHHASIAEGIMLKHLNYIRQPDGSWREGPHGIDFVGKTEHLVDDFIHALQWAGEQFDEKAVRAVPPVNVAGRLPELRERRCLSTELYQSIVQANALLCRLFDYT